MRREALTAGQRPKRIPTPIDTPSPTSGDHRGTSVGSDGTVALTLAAASAAAIPSPQLVSGTFLAVFP